MTVAAERMDGHPWTDILLPNPTLLLAGFSRPLGHSDPQQLHLCHEKPGAYLMAAMCIASNARRRPSQDMWGLRQANTLACISVFMLC